MLFFLMVRDVFSRKIVSSRTAEISKYFGENSYFMSSKKVSNVDTHNWVAQSRSKSQVNTIRAILLQLSCFSFIPFWWDFKMFVVLTSSKKPRSISVAECGITQIGGARFRPDPIVAVSSGAPRWFVEFRLHNMGGNEWGVQTHRSGRGGSSLGRTKSKTQYELR